MTDIINLPKSSFNITVKKVDGKLTVTDPITVKNQINELRSITDIPNVSVMSLANGATIIYNSNNQLYEIRPLDRLTNLTVSNTAFLNRISANGSFGNNNNVLTSNGSYVYWSASGGGAGTISGIVAGNGLFGGGSTGTVTLSVNSDYIAILTSNNANYAYGKKESQLSVANAVYSISANNAIYAYGKQESQLSVANSVYTTSANNADYAYGKQETQLSVANAVYTQTANNATYAYGKQESQLSVANAVFAASANNAIYAYGKQESQLSVANSVYTTSANNADYAYGKQETQLSVANAVYTQTANNATYAYGKQESQLSVANTVYAQTANNSTFAYSKQESQLSVANAVYSISANNSTYAYSKQESQLSVANAVFGQTSNNSNYAYGKQESQLSVANAVYAQTANNATYAYGKQESQLSVASSNTSQYLDGYNSSYYTNATNISSGTLSEACLPYHMNQDVRTSDTVEFRNLTVTGNVYFSGNSTLIHTDSVATTDSLIYLNEASPATVTNAVGNGTYVTYTANNKFITGQSVIIVGMNPVAYNISGIDYLTISTSNTTQFTVAKSSTGAFISGGTAYAKAALNPDVGFVAGLTPPSGYQHIGFFRDATDGVFKVFDSLIGEPDGPFIDTENARIADFQANVITFSSANVGGTLLTSRNFYGTANNSIYAYGKQESQLSVANSVYTQTANNSSYLSGYNWASPDAIGSVGANTVNATSYTVGSAFVANSTGIITTGTLSAGNTGVTGIISFTDRILAAGPSTSQSGYAEFSSQINSTQTVQQNMVSVQGQVSPQATANLNALYGLLFLPTIVSSANNITNIFPVYARVDSNVSYTGTVTNLNTFTAANLIWSSATAINNVFHYTAENTTATTSVIGFRSQIISGTGKYNFYASGNASNYFAGSTQVGGGLPVSSSISLSVNKSVTGATSSYGISHSGPVQSDVTTQARAYNSTFSIANNSSFFTLGNYYHFGTIHTKPAIANATITALTGFFADAALLAGVTNYGFSGSIPSSSVATISNVSLTNNVATISTVAAHPFWPGQTVTIAATTTTSLNGSYVISSCPSANNFTYNKILADIASVADTGTATVSTGRWNAYMGGSAPNYFAGATGIGTTTLTNGYLSVSGTQSSATSMFDVRGTNQSTTPTPSAMTIAATLTGNANTITNAYGINLTTSGIFANTIATYAGILNNPNINSANSPANFYGVSTQQFYLAGATGAAITLSAAYLAVAPSVNAYATANITTHVGFRAASVANGALNTITNIYAFQGQQNISAFSNTYNLYMSGSARNYLAGALGIATTTPDATLAINGTANVSGAVTFGSTLSVVTSVNSAALSVGSSFVANTSQVTILDIPLNANNSFGSGSYILTSNGSTGAPYWSSSANSAIYANTAAYLQNRTWESAGAIGSSVANTGAFTTLTTSGNVNIDSGTLFVDATTNFVGINNTSPTQALQIDGSIVIKNGLVANGSFGSVGNVLTSNGSSVYWAQSTGGAGVNVDSSYTWTNTHSFTNTRPSGNAVTGTITVSGGVGVSNNIYVGGRVGFSNSTNISVVYEYYNAATNSLDTVFG